MMLSNEERNQAIGLAYASSVDRHTNLVASGVKLYQSSGTERAGAFFEDEPELAKQLFCSADQLAGHA